MSRAAALSAAAVPAAFFAANAASYALLLVAAHRMSSVEYGALSSLLGLLLISTVPMLALQTVSARRAARDGDTAGVARGTIQLAFLSAGLLAAVSPALSAFLHLHDVLGILFVAATVPATAAIGAATGLAQGRREFRRLAALVLAGTGARSLGGLLGLLIGGTPDATLAGQVIGVGVAVAVAVGPAWRPARRELTRRGPSGTDVVVEALHAGHAHGAFLLLTSLDVLLARHVLSAHEAGVYAVGAVVTRAALWLPQSVILLLFASLAESEAHRAAARRAGLTVAGLGVVAVAGAALFGRLVVSTVGGAGYHQLDDRVWLFALLGALLAVVQLAVLAGLAQRNRRRAAVIWATAAADLVVVLTTDTHVMTPTRLVVTLLLIAGVAAIAALWLTVRRVPADAGRGSRWVSGRARPVRE